MDMNEYEALLEIAEQELDELRETNMALSTALGIIEALGDIATTIGLVTGERIYISAEDSITEDAERYIAFIGDDRVVVPKTAVAYIKEKGLI